MLVVIIFFTSIIFLDQECAANIVIFKLYPILRIENMRKLINFYSFGMY